eukprot:15446118-Alexandrium_andersonii.AAC.1
MVSPAAEKRCPAMSVMCSSSQCLHYIPPGLRVDNQIERREACFSSERTKKTMPLQLWRNGQPSFSM